MRNAKAPWAGIGEAFARHLAAEGLNVVLVARRQAVLQALAAELQQAHGVQCGVLAMDLSGLAASKQHSDATGNLDAGLLVAAAGFGTSGPLLSGTLADEAEMVGLNCRAVAAQAWHFGQRLGERGHGGVVFMSSLLAFHGTPRAAHYAATKAYVQSLAEGLRVEWAPLGVDVIASASGPISSGFAARANMHMAQALPAAVVARVTMQAWGARPPCGRASGQSCWVGHSPRCRVGSK